MSEDLPHILVVDDDKRLRELLRRYLSDNGFMVMTAADGDEARAALESIHFDLMVLDRMMPGGDGLGLARSLRAAGSTMPILVLTALGEAQERIAGFENGADDYLSKPFEPRELVLRMRTILRRAASAPPAVPAQEEAPAEVQLGLCLFHVARLELLRGGRRIRLTDSEARLLGELAANAGIAMSREELTEALGSAGGGRNIDVQVTRLRRKIEPDPKMPRYLHTVRGKGYMLRPD